MVPGEYIQSIGVETSLTGTRPLAGLFGRWREDRSLGRALLGALHGGRWGAIRIVPRGDGARSAPYRIDLFGGVARNPAEAFDASRESQCCEPDVVLEADLESFPASDPPSWTRTTIAP